jgi:hypothetical protein
MISCIVLLLFQHLKTFISFVLESVLPEPHGLSQGGAQRRSSQTLDNAKGGSGIGS